MNVIVRSKRGNGVRRRREGFREARGEQPAPHAEPTTAHGEPSVAATALPAVEAAAAPPRHKVRPPAAISTNEVRREHGTCSGRPLTNDQAMYTCQCGFVFEAPVSTSVGCPHCGSTQAW
jgi:hypothetical protein